MLEIFLYGLLLGVLFVGFCFAFVGLCFVLDKFAYWLEKKF